MSCRYSSTLRTISWSGASSSSTSAAVEIALPLPYFTGAGSFRSSNSTLAELLRRADVERLAGQLVDLGGEARDLGLHQAGEALQLDGVDADAGALHARQHARQRQLDRLVELAQAALIDRGCELVPDFQRDVGVLLGRGAELQVEPPPRLLVERAARGIGVQQEGVQHHVVIEAAGLDSHAVERQERGLHVARDLDGGRVLQPGLQGGEVLAS